MSLSKKMKAVYGSLLLLMFACSWLISGLFYAMLAVLTPCFAVILVTKLVKDLLGGETGDALKIVLGALTVSAVLFWVLQGSLSTRLNLRLSGQAYTVSSQEKRLVVVGLRLANIGNNNVSLESAKLTFVPKKDGVVVGRSETLATSDIGFGPGSNKDSIAVKLGIDGNKYYLTWGTDETRQVSQVLAAADYYEIYLEVEAAQRFPRSVSTWRAVTVIPGGKDIGRSPAIDEGARPEIKDGSILEKLKKKLAGE